MAIIPQYKLKGLRIKAYDAGNAVATEIADPITSEYDDTNKVFGKLGDVFSISAQGYADYLNGATIEECQAKRFSGASRVCIYPATEDSHPEQIRAILGFNSEGRPYTWPGYYPNTDSVSEFVSGNLDYPMALSDGRVYFTLVYDKETTDAYVYWACDKTFASTVCEHYPSSFEWIYNQHPFYDESWIMSYVEAVEITGDEQKLQIDQASLLLGWLTGKRIAAMRNKKNTAGTCLYNGADLPTLPGEVAKLQYAAIYYDADNAADGKPFAQLYIMDSPVVYSGSIFSGYKVTGTMMRYVWVADESTLEWSGLLGLPDGMVANKWFLASIKRGENIVAFRTAPTWANFDILKNDGTVILEASEPIPVYE